MAIIVMISRKDGTCLSVFGPFKMFEDAEEWLNKRRGLLPPDTKARIQPLLEPQK